MNKIKIIKLIIIIIILLTTLIQCKKSKKNNLWLLLLLNNQDNITYSDQINTNDESIIIESSNLQTNNDNNNDNNNVNNDNNNNNNNDESSGIFEPASGELDNSFGSGGKVIMPLVNTTNGEAKAILILPSNKILIAGHADVDPSDTQSDFNFIVLQYESNGNLDTTFGTGGKVETNIGGAIPTNDYANAIAIQGTKILVAGTTDDDFAVVRYESNGNLDTTFGSGGIVKTNIGGAIPTNDDARAIAVQGTKILVAGTSDNDFAIVRYESNGSLDTTFGSGGIVKTNIGGAIATNDNARAIAVQGTKILVAGYTYTNMADKNDFVIVRYESDGSLDSTFGSSGKVITNIGTGTNDMANAIILQSNGKILVAGSSLTNLTNKYDFVIVRYESNGSLDTTFGSGGKVITNISTNTIDMANAITLQPDGNILVAGTSNPLSATNYDFTVARYNSLGTLDNSFNYDGIVTTDIGTSTNDTANAIAVRSDGKIFVAGTSDEKLTVISYK